MEFEKQLQGLMVVQDPGARFTDKVLASLRARVSGRSKARSRFMLIGVMAVFCAAAAMLVWQLQRPTLQTATAEEPVPAAASHLEPQLTKSKVDVVAPEAAPDTTKSVPASPLPALPQFTVLVLPLQNEATNVIGKRAVAATYAATVELLRKTPGVKLLEPDHPGDGSEIKPEYRITIVGRPGGDDKTPIILQAVGETATVRADGSPAVNTSSLQFQYMVEAAPNCVSTPLADGFEASKSTCADPDGVAADMVGMLRRMVFPLDQSAERQFQLQARLRDRSLDSSLRMGALADLRLIRLSHTASGLQLDPDTIRGAIELANTATDPVVRAAVWSTLRGAGNKELVPPLLDALGKDADSEVRLAALGTLSGEFSEDPRVQAAFKATAQRDARPLVRALAQRAASGVAGEAGWREYTLVTLKDTSRPAVERLEALFIQMGLPISPAFGITTGSPSPLRVLNLLDAEAIKALTEVLPRATKDSTYIKGNAHLVVNALRDNENPAVTDMLLASLDSNTPWVGRGAVIRALGAVSRQNDPRVRAMLEKISSNDADPALRSIALASLHSESAAVSPVAAGTSRGLGVYVAPMEPGPYVPKELMGKPVVSRVEPGSAGQNAGVREGDLLLEINGTPIPDGRELYRILETVPRGVDIDVVVYRFGETVKLKARL